jgi:hypothetical protein
MTDSNILKFKFLEMSYLLPEKGDLPF